MIKGGLTLNQLVNLGIATGQNLPYNHVVQAWNGADRRLAAGLPAGGGGLPAALEPRGGRRVGRARQRRCSWAPGSTTCATSTPTGTEGAGFPKFTGGWLFSVPAIGDTDGDGKLEMTALTREGYSFQWDTDRPACGTNDEWWTARHDEWYTGAYGTDSRPPGTPRKFTLDRSRGPARSLHGLARRRLAVREGEALPT